MSAALALIDGNSFYCSCERVFDPKLAGVPLIVLSNNDGCAIARTAEAKPSGICMGGWSRGGDCGFCEDWRCGAASKVRRALTVAR